MHCQLWAEMCLDACPSVLHACVAIPSARRWQQPSAHRRRCRAPRAVKLDRLCVTAAFCERSAGTAAPVCLQSWRGTAPRGSICNRQQVSRSQASKPQQRSKGAGQQTQLKTCFVNSPPADYYNNGDQCPRWLTLARSTESVRGQGYALQYIPVTAPRVHTVHVAQSLLLHAAGVQY